MTDTPEPGPTQPPDYHTHTFRCKHAEGLPLEYARAAAERGFREIACTDHAPALDGYDPKHRMAVEDFALYLEEVRAAQTADTGCRILCGMEADYYRDAPSYLVRWLPRQPADLVLGSVHYLDYWNLASYAQRGLWDGADVTASWQKYFTLLGELADCRLFDVVTHLDLPKRFGKRPPEAAIREMALPVLDGIAAAGLSVELNTSGLRHPCAEIYPSGQILGWMCERAIPIVFGSDAHKPEQVGACFEQAVAAARAAGYTQRAEYRGRRRRLVAL